MPHLTRHQTTSANFSLLRYAQCWEDADVLLAALEPGPEHLCLSIASGGDNTLALLSRAPARVIAVDLNPAQIACLELRVAAYRELDHAQLLELIGSRPSARRGSLYQRCRRLLSIPARDFWDARPRAIESGIGGAGKFERYFALFRTWVLPLVHSRLRVERLLAGGPQPARELFYANEWNTRRWRLLFRIFFSRFVMGRFGRDPAFFRYVQGNVAESILSRTQYALTALDPAANPYLQWILTGTHTTALPFALRPENFEPIRANLDRLEWAICNLDELIDSRPGLKFDRFNLSDLFEYMSAENYERLLQRLLGVSQPGARFAYWNMLAPRRRPPRLAGQLCPMDELASNLFLQDKAWFYSALILEETVDSSGRL